VSTELHEVRLGPAILGLVPYQNTADVWYEAVYLTRDDFRAQRPIGRSRCELHPTMANRHPTHRLVMAEVHDAWGGGPSEMLYCPTCKCMVAPPHDGYVYLDYPKGWLPQPSSPANSPAASPSS
jgi:hypothetical protein